MTEVEETDEREDDDGQEVNVGKTNEEIIDVQVDDTKKDPKEKKESRLTWIRGIFETDYEENEDKELEKQAEESDTQNGSPGRQILIIHSNMGGYLFRVGTLEKESEIVHSIVHLNLNDIAS